MTILRMLADGTIPPRPTFPAPIPPSDVHGATEIGEDVRAVVGIRVAVTRDMLAVALDDGCNGTDEHPDTWSVEFIRESVELYLAMYGYFRLQEQQHLLIDFLWSEPAGPCRDRVQAEYRAIDRAYPQMRLDRLERLREQQERCTNDPEYRKALLERVRATCTGPCFDESFGR